MEPSSCERIDALIHSERGSGEGPMGTRELRMGPIFCNLPVSVLGGGMLWVFAIFCMASPEAAQKNLADGQAAATELFTWLYIGSNGIWILFLIAVYVSYGHVKLGKDDEKPEFDDAAYFTMLFSAGTGIGLIFYGASEPMAHYQEDSSSNRYAHAGYLSDNEAAQWAINITLYHWGVHGWVVYSLTGILLGVMAWKYDLPLTYRCCFWPLFGRATWGWMGDILDSITIIGVVSGVCTSLGLGASQTVTGMQRIGWFDPTCPTDATPVGDCLETGAVTSLRCGVIGVITLSATASVVSGVGNGVKLLSQIAFGMGMFLLGIVFFLDNPWYLLNLMTQSTGFYVQWLTQIGWYCDAFTQLKWGEGKAVDGKGGHESWMNWWTIFYWGWWISWSPFVGVFLARISRGRTIRNVINYTISVPMIYEIIWFCVFGGAALRMDRRASLLAKAGTELYANASYFIDASMPSGNCYKVPAQLPCPAPEGIVMNASSCPPYAGEHYTATPDLSPVCTFMSSDSDAYWFDLMNQYYGLGPLLSGFTIFTIALFFVTSSDSGSMVVDLIASNGREAHVSQRIFWSFTEGGLAMSLLVAGGEDALKALRSAAIMAGVPFTIFVCYICLALWRILAYGENKVAAEVRYWALPLYGGIFDAGEWVFSLGKSPFPSSPTLFGFAVALFCPPFVMYRILREWPAPEAADERTRELFLTAATGFSFGGFVICHVLVSVNHGLMGIAWFCYCCFATVLMVVRLEMRNLYHIEGSPLEDALTALFFYPQVLWQMAVQVEEPLPKKSIECETVIRLTASSQNLEGHEMQPMDLEGKHATPDLCPACVVGSEADLKCVVGNQADQQREPLGNGIKGTHGITNSWCWCLKVLS